MERKDYRLAAILYTDIAGFSKMMEKNEALTLELLNTHNRIIEDIVRARGGKVIKTIGDAFLIDFKNTVDALQSAIDIQYQLYEYNKQNRDLPLLVRIGVHLGDIYFYENDALGEGINIAARLQSIAHPGCICMSGDVYNHVLNKVDFKAEKLGRVSLKNITKEIHAYEIATPNVEFDPNAASRTILAPAKDDQAPPPDVPPASEGATASSGDDPAAAGIKRRIMLDIKAAGRRLGADQMRVRYGAEGPAAERVIADMEAKGLLLKAADQPPRPEADGRAAPWGADGREGVVRTVSALEYRIEDEIRRGLSEAFSSRRARRAEFRAARREERKSGDRWERRLSDTNFSTRADALGDSEEYELRVRKEARSATAGFIGHLIPFVAVNAGLMALNAAVSPSFPWAIFPFGGWAIGVLEHYMSVLRKKERLKELEKLPVMDADGLSVFKTLQKKKDSFWLHLASAFSTSAFLAAVNAVVSPQFKWFLFPAAAMFIGLLSHAVSYSAKKRELKEELKDLLGAAGAKRRTSAARKSVRAEADDGCGAYRPLVAEARSVRDSVAAMLSPAKGAKRGKAGAAGIPADDDLLPTVDAYVEQVALLAERTCEADLIIEQIPMDAVRADKASLRTKLETAQNDGLRKEYEKSLAELERQERSFEELEDQRELLELRLRSSVNTLKQLRIDLARLSGMPAGGENATVDALRGKTLELNRYLDDLRAGYAELDALEDRSPEETAES